MKATSALSALCLAAALSPALSAQTMEKAKSASDAALAIVTAPKLADVCFGRGAAVQGTREAIARAEKGVTDKTLNVGQGVDLVMRKVGADNAQCVAKTILADAREKGDLASSITVEDNGKAISIMVASNGGPVLFKGSSEAGAYAFQVLTYRLQRLAQPVEESRGGCGARTGKDSDQTECPRRFFEDAASRLDILKLLPDPVSDRDVRGGKDGEQLGSGREAPSRD